MYLYLVRLLIEHCWYRVKVFVLVAFGAQFGPPGRLGVEFPADGADLFQELAGDGADVAAQRHRRRHAVVHLLRHQIHLLLASWRRTGPSWRMRVRFAFQFHLTLNQLKNKVEQEKRKNKVEIP